MDKSKEGNEDGEVEELKHRKRLVYRFNIPILLTPDRWLTGGNVK